MDSELLKYDTRWFKYNTTPSEVENIKAQLLGDKKTLDLLRKIVYNIVISEQRTKISDYDCPSWSHKAAHRNGLVEAYNSILSLVTIEKDPQDVEIDEPS